MNKNLEKQSNFISAIVYLKDNEDCVGSFLRTLDSYLKENFLAYEYIIVNNMSKDNSVKNIKEIKNEIGGKITIINLAHHHTIEAAMVAGHKLAIGDYVFEFESPVMDYKVEDIDNVYKKALTGFDIVTAASTEKESFLKRVFYGILKTFGETKSKLHTESFKILSRRAINRIYKEKFTFLYRKLVYESSGFDTFIYRYEKTSLNCKKKRDTVEEVSAALNIILRYTKVYLLLPIVALVFFAIFIILSFITSNIFIGIGIFLVAIISILSIIVKLIQDMYKEFCKTPLYVFKSVERL